MTPDPRRVWVDSSASLATAANGSVTPKRDPLISIVTPCYCEAENLPVLRARMDEVLATADFRWEHLIIDDHSPDNTFEVAAGFATADPRVKVARLARNSGAHLADYCGLELSQGDAAIIMAADLQDPPEVIPQLVARWRAGDQVVWACRRQREGVGWSGRFLSKTYYALLRRLVPNETLPPQGADFFLLDRRVIDALARCKESNFSILALILWLGFRQGQIDYDKQARLHGRSNWNITKKIRLVIDSVVSFSHLPLRLISVFGFIVAVAGFAYALYVAISYFIGNIPVEGWASLMVVTLLLAGTQMIMLGVIGEYVWRTLHESRQRPRYNIERAVAIDPQPPAPRSDT
jgi:glycosyltransferase involved in cell wall biosynthesis